MPVEYAMTVRTAASFTEANARIRLALMAQGFVVLTEIDVQSTLRRLRAALDTLPPGR